MKVRNGHALGVAYLALIVALGGSAYAMANIRSSDIVDNQVKSVDVRNNSLKGKDIKEGTLSRVPSALLGGMGRMSPDTSAPSICSGPILQNCNKVELTLRAPARVLVIGTIWATNEPPPNPEWDYADGECELGTTGGPISGTFRNLEMQNDQAGEFESLSLVGVTGVFPKGKHAFGIDCVVNLGVMKFFYPSVVAVALSSG